MGQDSLNLWTESLLRKRKQGELINHRRHGMDGKLILDEGGSLGARCSGEVWSLHRTSWNFWTWTDVNVDSDSGGLDGLGALDVDLGAWTWTWALGTDGRTWGLGLGLGLGGWDGLGDLDVDVDFRWHRPSAVL